MGSKGRTTEVKSNTVWQKSGSARSVHWAKPYLDDLKHEDALVRWHAINKLGDVADPSTCDQVLEFSLTEKERHAAWRALWAVSRFERSLTFPSLRQALRKRQPYPRWRAALALSMMDQEIAIPVLLEGLKSHDEWIQWEALGGLQSLRPEGAEEMIGRFLRKSHPKHLRQRAVLALGGIRSRKSFNLLNKALTDPFPGVRWRASMGIRKNGYKGALQSLKDHIVVENDPGVLRQLESDITLMEKSR